MRRSRLALGLAFAALAGALIGALGPADEVRTTYSWPPAELPEAEPTTLWHTPLMLLRRQPESVSVRIPCSLPPTLPDASRPAVVIATTRFPGSSGGLVVTGGFRRLEILVGEEALARVALEGGVVGADCVHRLELMGATWSFENGTGRSSQGSLAAMPVVDGIFSELDLAAGTPPSIEVTTSVHDVEPTLLQTLAWAFSALAIAVALGLVAFDRRPGRPWPAIRRAAAHARPVDALVGVALLLGWVLGPAYWDDGWIAARLASYADAGGFSTYYDVLGSNNPLGFWLDWLQRLFLLASDSLLVTRLPALLALAATWVLCRWILARSAISGIALWSLAAVFLLGASAWAMTLRPEFALALLVTATLACTVRFLERETVAPLACVAVLVTLAVLAHPAGFVAAAPLLLTAPRLFRWARARAGVAATLVVAAAALTVLLGFAGSDLEQRREDARAFETYGTATQTWRDESLRYTRMSEFPYATPVRRAWVALAALAVLGLLLRRRRAENPLLDLPSAALGLGLVLLVATPSKWPWHFGALLGVAALAAASETARLRSDSTSRWEIRPFVIVGATMVASAWSWSPRTPWGLFDLRVLEWIPAFESRLSLSRVAYALPVVLAVGLGLVEVVRHGRRRLAEVPWRVATWSTLVLTVPTLAFTVAVLVLDNAKANAWTLARQNLGTLRGDADCGLAEEFAVAAPASLRPLAPATPGKLRATSDLPPPPVEGLSIVEPPQVSHWFAAPQGGNVGLFLTGAPGPGTEFRLEWGRRSDDRIELLSSEPVPADVAAPIGPAIPSWRFFAAGELPARPAGANVVRIAARSPGRAMAATGPVGYENERLARLLEEDGVRTFAVPDLLMFFPCVRQPRIHGGIADVPDHLLTPFDETSWLDTWEASPFRPLLEVYPLERRSFADTEDRPDIALFEVGTIPGAAVARPTATEGRSRR